jgi:hypothetical protein
MQNDTYTLDEVRELLGLGPVQPLRRVYDRLRFAGWRDGKKVWTFDGNLLEWLKENVCDDCNGTGFFHLWSADTGWVGHFCWLCKDDMKAMWE